MFKKHNRLNAKLIPKTLKLGRQIKTPFFTVFIAPSSTLHVGVSISKKVAPLAVTRNHIKRMLTSTLHQQPNLPVANYFFVVKNGKVTFEELNQEIGKILNA